MFKIYSGDTKFTQWTKNQKLIMSRLPLGAEVLFYNDPKEDEPLVTKVYEYTDENDISFHVCDVPNIFLTDTKRIKVRIPSKVVGLYGIVHSYVGQLERYFEVEAAEKPADYVYEETPTEGCGGHDGSVSEDQVQSDLSQTDNTATDYVKGVIRQESLPEGYPYKEGEKHEIVWDGNAEGLKNIEQFGLYLVSDAIISNDACKQGIVYLSDGSTVPVASMWDNIVTNGAVTDDFCCFDLVYVIRTAGVNIMGVTFDTPGVYFLKSGDMYVTKFTAEAETIHTMAPEFMPEGYPYKEGMTIEWDGNTTGLADYGGMYRISDKIVPYADFANAQVWYTNNGSGKSIVKVTASDMTSIGIPAYALSNTDEVPLIYCIYEDYGNENATIPAGMYFSYTDANNYVSEFSSETIHPMAPEFLPDEYVTETELMSKGYLTSYTETDPTVPTWAKAETKPSYDFSELTVNDPEAAKTTLAIENGMVFKNLKAIMPKFATWISVTYGNGKFVSIIRGGNIAAYSEDGITWTAITMPSSASWSSVTYGNDKFVAVSIISNKAAYSEDGITWAAATMPSSATWSSVTYGNGKFVAVAEDTNQAAYSEDGITWTTTTMPSSASWYSVAYGNGRFVAVTVNLNNVAAYSEDGITWTSTTMPSSASWSSVTYGNDKFVAVYENIAAYSEDGITWTTTTMPSSANWKSVTYGNGKFVAVAKAINGSAYDVAACSEDGITWTATTMPSSAKWSSVTYGNDKFVAVAQDTNKSAYSEDGITWKNTIEYLSQNNSNITESVRSVINNETIVGVPACTTADNGKVLKVVDGVPTWVEA